MKYIIYLSLLISLFSCKKECPAPLPGNTIYQNVIGKTYSGNFTTRMATHHYNTTNSDSIFNSYVYIYDTPTDLMGTNTSTLNSLSVNNETCYYSPPFYVTSSFNQTLNNNLFLLQNVNYNINSSKYGIFTLTDNRAIPTFTNQNSISLSFSQTNPYILTLNGLTNCTYATVFLELNDRPVIRKITPSNTTTKFYYSEIESFSIGDSTRLYIELVNESDTIISGNRFKLQKNVIHNYSLKFIP